MTTVLTITLAIAWLAASATARYWWWRASHDRLTGLPGRELLEARARRACWRASVGVLLLDLDGFKQVNDTFGHRVGDELLVTVAARLRRAVRRGETALRLHGDEFAVWLGALDATTAAQRAAEVAAALAEPLHLDGQPLAVTASVGHAVGDARRGGLGDLLHTADQAMYVAKRAARLSRIAAATPASRLRDQRGEVA